MKPNLLSLNVSLKFQTDSNLYYPGTLVNYSISMLNLSNNSIGPENVIFLYFQKKMDLSLFSVDFASYTKVANFNVIKIVPKSIISNFSTISFKSMSPPFGEEQTEIFLSIRNRMPLQKVILNATQEFFKLNNTNFSANVLDSLQYSDYNVSFEISQINLQVSQILVSMEGYFNLTYFAKPNFFMVEIFKNNQKLNPNFDFNVSFVKSFIQILIVFRENYFINTGSYSILLVNMKNSFQNRPNCVNITLRSTKATFYQDSISIFKRSQRTQKYKL